MAVQKKIFLKYIPVIGASFAISALVPNPVSDGALSGHLSGIALGFGLAWLLNFLWKLKEVEKGSSESNITQKEKV